jgi:glycosyltransferase involved in cell wall biosynthesis
MNRCCAVAAPSVTAATALRRLGYRGAVATLSNGVDTRRFRPGRVTDGLRSRLRLDERPVVLYTGRLDAEKRMIDWLTTAARLTSAVAAQFLICGEGSDRPHLEQRAREFALQTQITFAGFVSDDDLPEVYRLADVYFVTSPVELQSIATLEAMASGLPVVAVRAGALPEIVHHGENGYLVDPRDTDAAALALSRLLLDPDLRRDLGAAGRRIALGHDLQQAVDAYEDFLTYAASAQREPDRGGIVCP